jgi:hypothetical protein
MESKSTKFLENDLNSGSDQIKNIVSKNDHSESQPFNKIIFLTASLKYKLVLNDQSLKFHKLLTTF